MPVLCSDERRRRVEAMRLVTFQSPSGPRAGLVAGDRVIDIAQETGLPASMIEIINLGDAALETLRALASSAEGKGQPLEGLTLLAPIPRPRKNIFCLGLNYQAHIEEGRGQRGPGAADQADRPEWPTYFTKAPTTVIGPGAPIPLHPNVTERMDWEVELALVIGPGGINIPAERAYDHVFGYTIINDVSAREVQRRHGQQWFKGKSLDGTCPMGPWIVTRDELGTADNLTIECRVNGTVKQHSNTGKMIFTIPEMISGLSAGLTLEPGDVIATGTPEGVGFARNPPEFLKTGDVVECEIEGIGVLRNPVG
jgi:2-keto-4-pentenoate hydratase/2-oxohepta-3-ene-1,7-dioic acid hydratase in catechol pathway